MLLDADHSAVLNTHHLPERHTFIVLTRTAHDLTEAGRIIPQGDELLDLIFHKYRLTLRGENVNDYLFNSFHHWGQPCQQYNP